MAITKPDAVFTVTVNRVFGVISCAAKLAEEERGLLGFHSFTTCPDCKLIDRGWQMWGENGHKQAEVRTRDTMKYWIGRKAREQWRMKDGGMMGYRFRLGGTLYYRE